jgi:hypothetical protein
MALIKESNRLRSITRLIIAGLVETACYTLALSHTNGCYQRLTVAESELFGYRVNSMKHHTSAALRMKGNMSDGD